MFLELLHYEILLNKTYRLRNFFYGTGENCRFEIVSNNISVLFDFLQNENLKYRAWSVKCFVRRTILQ